MEEYIIIGIAALIGSGLTLFSGFGLGTVLMAVFALFFQIEVAIALTAIVHFVNNLVKLSVFWKNIEWKIALLFGFPSIITAIIGASLLKKLTEIPSLLSYSLYGKTFDISWLKIIISVLLIFFAFYDIFPKAINIRFSRKHLPLGGLLSGFFGGLSGHQGALRSAFLIRLGLSKEGFVATGIIIAGLIDVSRMIIYFGSIRIAHTQINYYLLVESVILAATGILIANRILKKITINTLQVIVAVFIFVFALFLGMGII